MSLITLESGTMINTDHIEGIDYRIKKPALILTSGNQLSINETDVMHIKEHFREMDEYKQRKHDLLEEVHDKLQYFSDFLHRYTKKNGI